MFADLPTALAERLFRALPPPLRAIEQDLQSKFKDILQATFSKLDLVTREEFDVQTKVLARTREKLEQLEKHVTALESHSKVPD